MNARARVRLDARVSILYRLLRESALPGERLSEGEAAQALGVTRHLVVSWIERGLLTASKLRISRGKGWYRIRRRALRRAIIEYPEVAKAILKAKALAEYQNQGQTP